MFRHASSEQRLAGNDVRGAFSLFDQRFCILSVFGNRVFTNSILRIVLKSVMRRLIRTLLHAHLRGGTDERSTLQ